MPALALARQNLERLRHFGPRDRVRNERHLVFDLVVPQMTMHAHDEVEILDDAVGAITSHGHYVLFAKQAERSGNDQIAAQTVPSQPAE